MSVPPKHRKRLPRVATLALLAYYELNENIAAEKVFTSIMHKARSPERAAANARIINRMRRLHRLAHFLRKHIYVKGK